MDNVAQTFQDFFNQVFEIDEQCIPFKGCHLCLEDSILSFPKILKRQDNFDLRLHKTYV